MTDPPSRPGRPEIVDYDKDYAAIHWTPSQHDGGSPIQKYVVDKRELPDPSWHTVHFCFLLRLNFFVVVCVNQFFYFDVSAVGYCTLTPSVIALQFVDAL